MRDDTSDRRMGRAQGPMSRRRRLAATLAAVVGMLALSTALASPASAAGSWTAQFSGTADNLHGVSFVDAGHGWAVGNGATILATTNGGATWTAQTSGTASFLFGVSFVDASHGWAVATSAPSSPSPTRRRWAP